MRARHQLLTLSPIKIAGVYFVFGTVWIASTDWLAITLVDTPETLTLLGTIKEGAFVGLSTLLIFGLTSIRQQRIDRSLEKLRTTTEQLQVLHRVFRHNIRNDINIIHGHIETVQDHLHDSEQQAYLETARQTAVRITTLSEKIRVINEVDPDLLSTDEVDLVALTEAELDQLQKRYPEANISTTMPDSTFIYGDSTLRHAIREILENAIEHNTNPQDQCEIAIEITRKYGQVELIVADNGPTIPQEELAPLQTREETALSHVSGIGLWLVTWLSQYRGGDVTFDTDTTQGTTVTFHFPVGTQIPLYQGD